MKDLVRPLKIETPDEGGTQVDFYPTEAKPLEDYLDAKGYAFESSTAETLDLSADVNIQSLSFASVLFNKKIVPDDSKNYIVSSDHELVNFDTITVDGLLTLNGDLVIFS